MGKIKEYDNLVIERFSEARARDENVYDTFQIHRGKMLEMLDYFIEKKLAWSCRGPSGNADPEWFALHPSLGEAVMSTIAIAIANDRGLDIVTHSRHIHHALVSKNDDEIFDELIGNTKKSTMSTTSDITDALAEVVMTTTFDLDRLNAQQIAELLKDGKDLRQFKNALISIAASIPEIRNPEERNKRLQDAAKGVISEWQRYKKTLPQFALEAIVDASDIKFPEIASTIITGATGLT